MLVDLHTHTVFSVDGHCSLDELCRAAAQSGLEALAVTEHYDMLSSGPDLEYQRIEEEREQAMLQAIEQWQGKLTLLYGVEIGQPYLHADIARDFLARHPFDIVLGSVHGLRWDRGIYELDYTSAEVCDQTFAQYFDEIEEMLDLDMVDVLAHLDYPMRVMQPWFPKPTLERYRERIAEVVRKTARKGVALEINTVGARRWQGAPGPERWTLELFRQYGGDKITFGSDAHYARDCGGHVRQAAELAKSAGFDRVTIFRGRKPEFLPL